MKNAHIIWLVLLNLGLVAVLWFVTFRPGTEAVADASASKRGKYMAVSGHIQGMKAPVVWIIDQSSQQMVAIHFDYQAKQFRNFGYRNLTQDAQAIRQNRP